MSLLRSVPWNWGLRSGLRSQTAGIYRFVARMVCNGGDRSRLLPFRLLSRRSGCVPALPYPPLRYLQSGSHQPRRTMIFHRTAITPLTFCLTGRVHRRHPWSGCVRWSPVWAYPYSLNRPNRGLSRPCVQACNTSRLSEPLWDGSARHGRPPGGDRDDRRSPGTGTLCGTSATIHRSRPS
jgi:hypothetical protein